MKVLKVLLAIVTLAAIATIVTWEAEVRTSPGPLHPVHAQVVELAGAGGCDRCHGGGGAVAMATACAECHAAIGAQLARGSGLHGTLADAVDCGHCHVEHHGAAIALVGEHAFAEAGVGEATSYDHGHVAGFALSGAHDELSCTACHEHADDEVLAAGDARFLGLDQTCTSCHADVHDGGMGSDCASCHGQEQPFAVVARFRHAAFALDGAHAGLRCDACHEPDSDRSVARYPADLPARSCADCHGLPHGPGGAALPLAAGTRDCADCHGTTTFARTFDVAAHAARGVPLAGAHATAACSDCHTSERAAAPPAPGLMGRCTVCHESPHGAIFSDRLPEVSGITASDCGACHAADAPDFHGARLEADVHAATGFPLVPPHEHVECASCHRGPADAPWAQRFPGRAPHDCAACHADPHAGQFDAGPTASRCTDCHARTHFVPPAFGLERHASTAFPLTGGHAAVACARCHEKPAVDAPRRFTGTPTDCARCHDDVHRGAFAALPATMNGRRSCARCHSNESFRDVLPGFDHGRFTGHELVGAHARADCATCHGRSAAPDARGRTLGRAPTRCASCHDDPHAGQFVTRDAGGVAVNDCARCHDAAATFHDLRFDHRDARFALDARHAKLSCTTCHRAEPTRSGELVVRYRPIAHACTDCHGGGGERR